MSSPSRTRPAPVPSTTAGADLPLGRLTLVLAVACGATVANLYYSQPLLDAIAGSFDVGRGTATLVVTLTQLGYAAALLLVLPVGDLIENRALVTRVLLGTAVALAGAAAAPSFAVFAALAVLIGVTSVVAQVLVPFAAHLAPEEARGRVVGRVMSGLLLGILLARTVSSLLADALGWRSVYVVSAVLMVVLALVLRRTLPERRPEHDGGYRSLLASVVTILREEPVLRARALSHATMFAAFSAFWTAIGYELADDHGLGQAGIGVFALVGAAGAAAAPLGGRLADAGRGRSASGLMFLLAAGAFALAGLGQGSVILLGLAGVLLDLSVQCHQVMAQQEIYALRPEARARINTVFMGSVFVTAAVASALTGVLHESAGWTGVCVLGVVLPLVGLTVWTLRLRPSLAR
ncbi:MFS transporter [Nocardioides sp. TRM66260-LWL]|uniref:MFS transporter n=1 Tax=Nocardioides sp. TRM66260-LWL TaxID=2874478 RepID=UPI001CC459D9|nr:MFS transporter [Nocardioides sp. TRM66260-LWL]MBZ5734248.1 MFS transporter [Nocardioides sp. TRM66260-LWL]